MEAVLGQPHDDAVVDHVAVLAQRQRIAATPDRQLGERIDIDALEERRRVGADDLDLAQRRRVLDPGGGARRQTLALERLLRGFARERKARRPLPLARVLEHGALARRPGVQRRLADRLEQVAAGKAGERAEGHRRVRLTERRQPDGGDRLAERVRRDRQRVEIGRLALVGAHAGGGVALDVFDRTHALARSERNVTRRDVVVEVDESLAGALGRAADRQRQRPASSSGRAFDARRLWRRFADRLGAGGEAVRERVGEPERAAAGAGRAAVFDPTCRQEALRRLVKGDAPARLRMQRDVRRPAAAHCDAIAGDRLAGARRAVGPALGDQRVSNPTRSV